MQKISLEGKKFKDLNDLVNHVASSEEYRARTSENASWYFDVLKEICAKKEVRIVSEWGTFQGCSAAAMATQDIDVLWTYDNLSQGQSTRNIIKEYIPSSIDFQYRIGDTRRGEEIDVDFTFLDNVHNGTWVYKELKVHAPRVKYYMAVHDTLLKDRGMPEKLDSKKDIVWHGVTRFLNENKDWELYKHVMEGSGIAVLRRVGWESRQVGV